MSDMQDFQDRGEPVTSPPPGRSRVYGWKATVVHDDDDYDEWADYCIPHCPDDVCHCADLAEKAGIPVKRYTS